MKILCLNVINSFFFSNLLDYVRIYKFWNTSPKVLNFPIDFFVNVTNVQETENLDTLTKDAILRNLNFCVVCEMHQFILLFLPIPLGQRSQCIDGNTVYAPGATYILSNCTKNCTCNLIPDFGAVPSCEDLCQKSLPPSCPVGTKPELLQLDVPGSSCKCNNTRCVNGLFI